VARMTLDQIMATTPDIDRARLEATSEADIHRHMQEDGEDPDAPLRPEDWVPSAAAIRHGLGMTQDRFAATLGVPVATLRNWEQGRVAPDPAARALLRILEREPDAALRALARPAA